MSPATGAGFWLDVLVPVLVRPGGRGLGLARARIRGREDRDRQVGDRLVAGVRHREGQVGVLSELLLAREVGADDLDGEVARWLVRVLALAAPAGGDARRQRATARARSRARLRALRGRAVEALSSKGAGNIPRTLPPPFQLRIVSSGGFALPGRDGRRAVVGGERPPHHIIFRCVALARRAGPRPSGGMAPEESKWSDP